MLKRFKQDQQPREAVAGIGDRAYFMVPRARGEHDRVGLLATQVGPHTLSLTLDAPSGKSGEAVKKELMALARMIVPKVR